MIRFLMLDFPLAFSYQVETNTHLSSFHILLFPFMNSNILKRMKDPHKNIGACWRVLKVRLNHVNKLGRFAQNNK